MAKKNHTFKIKSVPTIEELDRLQVAENIQNQSSKSDESSDDESDGNKNFESFKSNDNDFSSTWFFDFQNTNSLALQEQEFHTNCHTVLNHLNSLKEIANFFNNFDSKNVIQNNETSEQFELGKSALNELIQNDSLEKIYFAFQSLKLQKQNNATKNIKKNPSSSNLIPLSPNKKQSRHTSYSTL
ncbi:unnamed protein product [Rhizophagus irregularis]|uniref:Uncharacterized protein n=1 Tax=Rhizophagus irregularis TaxID=588596 RepID=A0A915ZKL8_9GLOM|nr:unnamed protein product [Rhizophagus irregularis]CAB5217085.1 unnamed protein product [Rhizophagus irregularis]CAB5381076.1 unnamed protein product [Rhizophagus irregularis]